MESEAKVQIESSSSIREKIDLEQWFYEQLLEMTRVQAEGNLKTYENMQNTIILRLRQNWPDGFEAEWNEARKSFHPDPKNIANKTRLELKEMLISKLMDEIGLGFTKKKKMKITKGVQSLWEAFPPFPPPKEPLSKN